MPQQLIDDEPWVFGNCVLTPSMRRDILDIALGLYDFWAEDESSYYWNKETGRLEAGDPNTVETFGDLFAELNGQHDFLNRWFLNEYYDDFYESLKDYICDSWGSEAAYEKDDHGSDPFLEAEGRLCDWLGNLTIQDAISWREVCVDNKPAA